MPLYMDFHKIENVTVEDVKTAHMADEAIQNKYGVKYHQFWLNQEAGSVFCLVEGPDAATCELVHKMAHGNIACALTEVETGFYEKMMGTGHKIDQGYVQHSNGTIDTGYRTILLTSITGITKATNSKQLPEFQQPVWAREIVYRYINAWKGRELKWEMDDSMIAVFDDASKAVACALQMQQHLLNENNNTPAIIFRAGISAAQPVTAGGDFFQQAIKLAHRLCMIACPGQILTSSVAARLCGNEQLLKNDAHIKMLSPKEEEFVSNLINVTERKLSDEQFDLNALCNEVSVSRPQLYRKVMALTGLSPNDFLKGQRMNKAISMLKQQKLNIAEIAYETGFSSPSYFSKCFAEKFGCTPSTFLIQCGNAKNVRK